MSAQKKEIPEAWEIAIVMIAMTTAIAVAAIGLALAEWLTKTPCG